MRLKFIPLFVFALFLCPSGNVPAAAQDEGATQLVIVFNDGHRQSFNLKDIARLEFSRAAQSSLPLLKPTEWSIVFTSDGSAYRYRFVWNGDQFTGNYVGNDNPSVFTGRMYTQNGANYLEYTQTDRRRPEYKCTYTAQETAPGKWAGTYKDNEGRSARIELTSGR